MPQSEEPTAATPRPAAAHLLVLELHCVQCEWTVRRVILEDAEVERHISLLTAVHMSQHPRAMIVRSTRELTPTERARFDTAGPLAALEGD